MMRNRNLYKTLVSHSVNEILAVVWLVALILAALIVRSSHFDDVASVMDASHVFESPSWHFPMGTDSLGRDYLHRVLRGSGITLLIAGLASILSLVMALVYGGISGLLPPRFDFLFSLILDLWMSIPTTVLSTLVALVFLDQNASLILVGVMIGATHWGRLARIVRGEVLRVKQKEFINAARILGANHFHIMLKHFIPHLKAAMILGLIYQLPTLILAESFMSFIGLGVQSPETSWGLLLQEGWRNLRLHPHMVFFPAGFLFLTILALNQWSGARAD